MRFTIDKSDLLTALTPAAGATNATSSLPILACVRIEAHLDGAVEIEGSDMELCVVTNAVAVVETAGVVALPAGQLVSIVKSLSAGPISIDATKALVSITSGRNRFAVTSQNAEDFPAWPEEKDAFEYTIPQAALAYGLSHVAYALPRKHPTLMLLGVNFDFGPHGLSVAACDAQMLGVGVVCEEPLQEMNVIVPTACISALRGALRASGDCLIHIGERTATFDLDGVSIACALVGAEYFHYRNMIPKDPTISVTMNREDLIDAVRRTALMADARTYGAIVLNASETVLRLSARSYESGTADGEIDCETVPLAENAGTAVEIAFNHARLCDTLGAMASERVTLLIVSPIRPAVFVGEGDPGATHVVNTVKLTDIAAYQETAKEESTDATE